jgi:hypothetical protein
MKIVTGAVGQLSSNLMPKAISKQKNWPRFRTISHDNVGELPSGVESRKCRFDVLQNFLR